MSEQKTVLPQEDAYEEHRKRRNLHLKIDGYFDSPQSLRRLLGYADHMLALQESGTISLRVANQAVTHDRDVEFRLAFSEPRDDTEQPKDALSGNDAIWLEQIASTADETEYDGNRSLWPEDVENLKRIAALLRRPKQAVGDVYDEIRAERRHQDEKWGGEAHDDEHGANDWLDIIDRLTSEYDHGEDARKVLLQIAAVAVAAIETRDRAAQRG